MSDFETEYHDVEQMSDEKLTGEMMAHVIAVHMGESHGSERYGELLDEIERRFGSDELVDLNRWILHEKFRFLEHMKILIEDQQ